MILTDLTEPEFAEALATFERSAFRLELQPRYNEPVEHDTLARFADGHPQDPTEVPALADWYRQTRHHTTAGRTIDRIRIHHDPPTTYQRWERWAGRWNLQAGETIRYLIRDDAYRVGLLPAAGPNDWWLLDDNRLIILSFDADYRRIRNTLTDDPEQVAKARAWRDLAVQHCAPDNREAPAP